MTRITITHEFEFEIEADVIPGCPTKWPSPSDDVGHPVEPAKVDDVRLVLTPEQLKRLRRAPIPWVRDNLTDGNLCRAVQNVLDALDELTFEGNEDAFEKAMIDQALRDDDLDYEEEEERDRTVADSYDSRQDHPERGK